MDQRAAEWFARRTTTCADWPLPAVAELKAASGQRVSVVIPARNEQATIGDVVGRIRADLMDSVPLIDELVVIDSLSTDRTAEHAGTAGAHVVSVADIVPDTGVRAGKGEALWKSLFVADGDLLVFIDADLTGWSTSFVTGLVGPLLSDPGVALVKGFYDRIADDGGTQTTEGGRVTELVARPLISLYWPELAAVVQPLAGEWAIRRDLFVNLRVPVGYGVEFATLLDTLTSRGLDAIAQVDLGERAHRHQSVHDLGVMAAEILHVAGRRGAPTVPGPRQPTGEAFLDQYDRRAPQVWRERVVPIDERPPALKLPEYRAIHHPDIVEE